MFDQVGEGVFRRRYDSLDLNIGVVVGDDGLLVVDTRASGRQAMELATELLGFSRLQVRWVVNTHWHWDHVLGNSIFADARIWAHDSCGMMLAEHGGRIKAAAREHMAPEHREAIDATEVLAPSDCFSGAVSLDIGRRVDLAHHGLGHTDSDITVTVPDAGVVFMGDLVEEGAPPSFGDSHPLQWPTTLGLARGPGTHVIVPGHGDVVDDAFVRAQHTDLVAVADLATRLLAGEIDMEAATGGGPYPPGVMRKAMERARRTAP